MNPRVDRDRDGPVPLHPRDDALSVLVVEDQPPHAELMIGELRRAGFVVQWHRVDTEAAYLEQIAHSPDLVLSDYTMPQFSADRALDLLHAHGLDIPFLVVSGTMGEEVAVALMRRGAADYVLKDRLARLGQAVERALSASRLRRRQRQADEHLRLSEERYRGLFEGVPVGLYRTTLAGEYVDVNPAFLAMLGYEDREALTSGSAVGLYVDPGVRSTFVTKLKREGVVQAFESQLRRRDGALIWVRASARIVRDDTYGALCVEGAVVDITEERHAEEEVFRRAAHVETLNAIISSAVAATDPSTLLKTTAALTLKALECEMGGIWTGVTHYFLGLPPDFGPTVQQAADSAGHAVLGPQAVPDWRVPMASTVAALAPVMNRFGVRASVAAPIRAGGTIIGGISVASSVPRTWRPDEVRLVDAIGSQIGEVMQRFQLLGITQRRTAELQAFYDLGRQLREAQTAREMYPILVEQAMRLLGAGHGCLALLDAERTTFTRVVTVGIPSEKQGSTFPSAGSQSGNVVQTGTALLSDDFGRQPVVTWIDPKDYAALGPFMLVPVRSERDIIGTLGLARFRGPEVRPFTEAEVRLIEGIAEMGGTAIRRVQLFEEVERRLQRAQALRDIDMAISGTFDLRVVLDVILDRVTTQLQVDAANILVVDARTQALTYAAGRGFRTDTIRRTNLRVGEGCAGRAAFERRTVIAADLAEVVGTSVGSALVADEGFVAHCAVPLIAKGQVLGVLELFHRGVLAPSHAWLAFLEALAGQAAIAVDNASLFADLQRSNTDLTLAYDTTLEGWSRALDLRDRETEGHTQRVVALTLRLARALGVGGDELTQIRRGALLHDIGKMGIPDNILLKPGPLTPEEREAMRKHPVYAYELLAPVAYLGPALDVPYCHHERWDGTGYPRGLKGEEIPRAARIFAVVDVWDALCSDRPYRPAWPEGRAREYIQSRAGSHFDPRIVKVFLELLDELSSDRGSRMVGRGLADRA